MLKYFLLFLLLPLSVNASVTKESLSMACLSESLSCNSVEKINADLLPKVYLFRASSCKYCNNLLTFLDSIMGDYNDYLTLEVYEVKNNSSNFSVLERVAFKFGDEVSYPYLVIGKTVFVGYNESYNKMIISSFKSFSKKANHYDVVSEVNAGNYEKVWQVNPFIGYRIMYFLIFCLSFLLVFILIRKIFLYYRSSFCYNRKPRRRL